MLSPDDEQRIETVLNEFARRGQTGAADTAALLAQLPARAEALEHLIARAKSRGLVWVEYLARTVCTLGGPAPAPAAMTAPVAMPITGAQLSAVLGSGEPYPRKVEALLAALRARHPELPAVVRKHLAVETDPFVLATLASAMGQCGTPLDGAILAPLLNHADQRVVANALDSMRRLRAPPRAEVMVRLLESTDNRVRTNAIAFLGVLDPDRALELVRALVNASEPTTRAGVAYVLGELADQDGATELLLDMNEREQNMVVLKQIAVSLKKHGSSAKAAQIVGPLQAAAEAATGAKRSVVATTLHEIAVEAGLVQAEVARLADEHRAKNAPPAQPTSTPIKINLPPPPAATTTAAFTFKPTRPIEGDEDLTFASVWGQTSTPSAATTTGAIRVPKGATSRSGSTPLPSRATPLPAPPPAPARSGAYLWLGAGVVALGLTGGVVAFRTTSPAPSVAPVAAASVPGVKPRKGRELPAVPVVRGTKGEVGANPIAPHLGPAGAPVSMEGKVVGIAGGKPVLEHKGQYYLVVRSSRSADELKRGAMMQIAGKIMGVSADGLFYVEEDHR